MFGKIHFFSFYQMKIVLWFTGLMIESKIVGEAKRN